MTTHEQQALHDSGNEAAIPGADAPRIDDESLAAAPDPAPIADTRETGAHVADTRETGAPIADTTETGSHVVEADQPSAQRESLADERLFAGDDLADLRARWAGVQAAFVDDPKDCVQKADVLVSDLVEQLTTGFTQARSRLEEQWSRGKEASTEDLRMALMHYREFFERLLAV